MRFRIVVEGEVGKEMSENRWAEVQVSISLSR